jgi:hypothetical protein
MRFSRFLIWSIVATCASLRLFICEGRAGEEIEEPGSPSSSAFDFRHKEPPILPSARVIDSTEFVLPGEGRSIFIERIQPPPGFQVPVKPTQGTPNPALSSLRLAEINARATRKPTKLCHFSCAVFDQRSTLVRWTHEGRKFAAWSSVNWNHVSIMPGFDSNDGTTRYAVILGLGNYRTDRSRPFLKATMLPDFSENQVTWKLIEGDPSDAAAQENLKAIHDYYFVHRAFLKEKWENLERVRMARVEWLKANPPEPHDIIVRHWEIVPTAREEGGVP